MTTIGEAVIEVRGDTSRLSSDVKRGASPGLFGKLGASAGKALKYGAIGAAAGIGAGIFSGLKSAAEYQKIQAQSAAVIKSTGGAANVTAQDVARLGSAVEGYSGLTNESVESGANLLLTFKNIRNEGGKGNKIFSRTTKTLADMSVAMGTEPKAAAVQLGKALNDPTKGLSALSRVGITFDAQQTSTIKKLQESGHTMKAQKIILKELNSEFGGSAKAAGDTFSGSMSRLKNVFGDLLRDTLMPALPALTKFAKFLETKGVPALGKLGGGFSKLKGFMEPVIGAVSTVFDAFKGADGAESKMTGLRDTFSSVFESVKTIVSSAVAIVTVLWNSFGSTLVSYATSTFKNVMQIVRGAFDVIAGIFKVVSSLLTGDWRGVWDGIKQVVRGAWAVIGGIVKQAFNLMKMTFSIAGIVIRGIFSRLWDGIKTLTSKAWEGIKGLASRGATGLVDFIKGIPGRIIALGGAFLNAGKSIGSKVITGLGNGLRAAGGFVSDLASSVKSAINSALHLPVSIHGPGPLPDFTIPAFAKGTNSAPGGAALVGENGPELVNLPRGSQVLTAARTRAMARSVGSTTAGRGGGALRLVSGTLSIDESGQAFIRGIASDEVDSAGGFSDTITRMG